jgi:tripartite-type tricarboxylate transporter receptor subunit TctC
MKYREILVSIFLFVLLHFNTTLVFAQAFPVKTVNVVVPFPPGGGADSLMRIIQVPLQRMWGQSIVIENKPGAAGLIGAEQVARGPSDGYNLLMTATGGIVEKNAAQFTPVVIVSAAAYVIVANPKLQANDVKQLIDFAKKNPGKVTFGSSGSGAASHLAGELFKSMGNVDMLHVPYKGMGPAISDLLGGQIDLMFAPAQAAMPNVKAGKLKVLAVTSLKRSVALPDIQTVAESGLPGFDAVGWFGLFAPAATPPEVVARISSDVNKVLSMPEIRSQIMALGSDVAGGNPEAFASFLREDQAKWAKLIKEQGIVVN